MLLRYRAQSLEQFSKLSAAAIGENLFQIQFPDGLQFWLDARFIVLRHDLKRVYGAVTVIGGMAFTVILACVLVLLESLGSVGECSAKRTDTIRVIFFTQSID